MNFGTILRVWRQKEKIGQEDAAKRLGISVNTYRTWEYKQRNPSSAAQQLILRTLFPNGYSAEISTKEAAKKTD
jgi:DNA-binding transcriptional regulator YiaG